MGQGKKITGPTFAEMLDPGQIDPAIRKQALEKFDSDPLDPINLFNISWKNKDNQIYHEVIPQELTGVDANGCVVIDSTLIEVIRDFAIPNAFSPNGDGINDVFVIRTPYLVEFALRIFNRWGEEVFASNDIMVAWDGTFQGKPQEVGTYIYYLDAVNDEGERVRRSGSVILVR